jgi:hypothetical protein
VKVLKDDKVEEGNAAVDYLPFSVAIEDIKDDAMIKSIFDIVIANPGEYPLELCLKGDTADVVIESSLRVSQSFVKDVEALGISIQYP